MVRRINKMKMNEVFQWLMGIQSPASFMIRLWARGSYVGEDFIGNKYYRAKARKNYSHERRWVRYTSENVEASEVPPEFHGWLHHQTNEFPKSKSGYRKPWQKSHVPNLTGTSLAYQPTGHQLQSGARDKVTGDYQPWTPNS